MNTNTGISAPGLPEGEYCEIVGNCTEMLSVAADGTATIVIDDPDVPFVAYCVGCGKSDISYVSFLTYSNIILPSELHFKFFTFQFFIVQYHSSLTS